MNATVEDDTRDAVNAALLRAMRKASFSSSYINAIAVESALVRAQMDTQETNPNLIYTVTRGEGGLLSLH